MIKAVPRQTEELLTLGEVITELRVSRATFARWRHLGTGPAWLRLPNGQVRIRRADLRDWLAGLARDHTISDQKPAREETAA